MDCELRYDRKKFRYGSIKYDLSKYGLYVFHGPVPDFCPCACCGLYIVRHPSQDDFEKHLIGCKCWFSPYICQSCMDMHKGKNTLCRFCHKPGTVVSGLFDNFGSLWGFPLGSFKNWVCKWSDPKSTRNWVCKWLEARIRFQDVDSRFCQTVLSNWNLCFLLVKGNVTHAFVFPYYDERLKENFFQSWLHMQLFQKRGKVSICYLRTIVNPFFLMNLRNGTFARLVNHKFFSGDYYYLRKLKAAILARILANFKTLFEISLKL